MELVQKREYNYIGMEPFRFRISYAEVSRNYPGNQVDSHVHPECEIYINLSGDVSFMVERHLYPILPGNIVITRPYEYHHCIQHTDGIHKHFWILFSAGGNEALLDRFFNRALGEDNLLVLPSDRQKELFDLCHEMTERLANPAEELYRFFMLMHLLECADIKTPSSNAYPQDIAAVLEYIEQNFSQPISVRSLASAAHVSVNTLERHFGEDLQMSPTAYIKKKRLANAAELLYRGSSVMEACQNSGFSDYSNFIALFKKNYGMTPLRYRRSHMLSFSKKES